MNSIDMFRSELRSDEDSPPSTTLAKGLGMFSLALGAAELAVPRLLARGIGIEPSAMTSAITRAFGAREIVAGIGVLLAPRSPFPLWGRVAGDVLDLAMLGVASTRTKNKGRIAGAIAGVAAVTFLDVMASVKAHKTAVRANHPVMFSVTIGKPARAVYEMFRDFARLPEFMDYLESVTELDSKRSRWVAKPFGLGKTVEWEAEITDDVPGTVIAWQSVEGESIQTKGRVTFAEAPGNPDATEVRVEMQLGVKFLGPSNAIAKFFSKPQIKGDLRRFKQVMETGEVLLSDATVTKKPHPAQPSEPAVIDANPHAVTSDKAKAKRAEVQP
jgi:uncharacterized membrane protein